MKMFISFSTFNDNIIHSIKHLCPHEYCICVASVQKAYYTYKEEKQKNEFEKEKKIVCKKKFYVTLGYDIVGSLPFSSVT